jgi:hypothetical protein
MASITTGGSTLDEQAAPTKAAGVPWARLS